MSSLAHLPMAPGPRIRWRLACVVCGHRHPDEPCRKRDCGCEASRSPPAGFFLRTQGAELRCVAEAGAVNMAPSSAIHLRCLPPHQRPPIRTARIIEAGDELAARRESRDG